MKKFIKKVKKQLTEICLSYIQQENVRNDKEMTKAHKMTKIFK